MADTPTNEGLEFLESLKQYVKWRITPSGPHPDEREHVERFRRWLLSLGAVETSEAFQSLMARMGQMKDGRGSGSGGRP